MLSALAFSLLAARDSHQANSCCSPSSRNQLQLSLGFMQRRRILRAIKMATGHNRLQDAHHTHRAWNSQDDKLAKSTEKFERRPACNLLTGKPGGRSSSRRMIELLSMPQNVIAIRHARRLLATFALVVSIQMAITTNEDNNKPLYPSLFVDTKYWIRNMEFGARENWHNKLRPCTLLERIAIDENGAVVSLGDNTFGSIESVSVRQLVLAENGVLLLERDTLESEESYIKFLNESGDCFDSSTLPEELQDQHWFRFGPDSSDQLSWFNSANWVSEIIQPEIAELVPDSHRIPCGEDVVVFGSRHIDAVGETLVEANERSPVFAFRVNFRPSEQMMEANREEINKPNDQLATPIETIRVSKLKIGDKSYTSDEFDRLVRLYGDNLFYFNDEKSIFNTSAGGLERWQRVLAIDESSIQATDGQEQEVCLDEAGCLCGNEQVEMMDIICSFNQPLELDDMPCLDPIRSPGYCNRICATSITINMTPVKFSERFLSSILIKLLTGEQVADGEGGAKLVQPQQDYFSDIFVGSRRIDQTRYEVTLRMLPTSNRVYGEILGRDQELASLIKQHLEKAAIKSFYGIKSISVKSSVLWRIDNRDKIFWLAFILTVVLSVVVFVQCDSYLMSVVLSRINLDQISDAFGSFKNNLPQTDEKIPSINDELMMRPYQNTGLDDDGGVDYGTELVHDVPSQEFSMIEIDARSITDSLQGLLVERYN